MTFEIIFDEEAVSKRRWARVVRCSHAARRGQALAAPLKELPRKPLKASAGIGDRVLTLLAATSVSPPLSRYNACHSPESDQKSWLDFREPRPPRPFHFRDGNPRTSFEYRHGFRFCASHALRWSQSSRAEGTHAYTHDVSTADTTSSDARPAGSTVPTIDHNLHNLITQSSSDVLSPSHCEEPWTNAVISYSKELFRSLLSNSIRSRSTIAHDATSPIRCLPNLPLPGKDTLRAQLERNTNEQMMAGDFPDKARGAFADDYTRSSDFNNKIFSTPELLALATECVMETVRKEINH